MDKKQAFEQHPLMRRAKDIATMVPYWDKVDAIVEGYDAVKMARETYLPKFAHENKEEYNARLEQTKFTNIYRDVLEGLASKPFEEQVTLKAGDDEEKSLPSEIEEFTKNVDGSGNDLTVFASQTFFNGINAAVDWIFVDYPTVEPGKVLTVADAKAQKIKPFWSRVLARNVLEVRSEIVNSEECLSYIRIHEPAVNSTPDRVRVFMRNSLTGAVSWELWERNEKATKEEDMFILIGEGVLSVNVIPLVPFITGRRDGKSFKFFPAMRDAADLQIVLYQDESALQNIKTLAGYPMLAANGLKPQLEADGKTPKKIAVGPGKVLYGVPDNAGNHGSWSYVEPSAQSMKFLQESIDKTKQDLRELGRQPLTAQSGQLTVITTAVAAGKARSAVSAWAIGLKMALENALRITVMYYGITYEPNVNVFTEFDSFAEGDADLNALTTMRENRDISQKTLWHEMMRRKVLSPDFDGDKETEELANEVPTDDPENDSPPAPADA